MTNEQKLPLSRTLPRYVDGRVRAWIQREGRAMPGRVVAVSGAIVTVNFDVPKLLLPLVQMPLASTEYVRYPIRPRNTSTGYAGDKGVAIPMGSYCYTGGVTGLGQSALSSLPQGNLTNLVWFPLGNKNWSAVDPNTVTIYGPSGVVLRDTTSAASVNVNPTSGITLSFGGHSLVIGPSGVLIDGVPFLPHTHGGVTSGTGVSGPVST